MQTQRTYYHLIIDKSGSMSDCLDNTISGFNEQLDMIRRLQLEHPNQQILTGLTSFNELVKHHFFDAPADKPRPLSRQDYRPNGTTALLDAIGQASLRLEEIINSDTTHPSTAVVVIITDGYENSSQNFNLGQIRSLIQRLEATEKWTFSFIGATLDAVNVATEMSIGKQNSHYFGKEEMKSEVWDKLSGSLTSYLRKKEKGSDIRNLFDEEK